MHLLTGFVARRRRACSLLVVMVLATAATSGALVVSSATPAGATTFSVDATVGPPGNATGFMVSNAVTVSATGTWVGAPCCPGTGGTSGPDGSPSWATNANFVLPSANAFALLGRVGTSGSWTVIGSGPTRLDGVGQLYLTMNDDTTIFGDNSGTLLATLTDDPAGCPQLNAGQYYGTYAGGATGTTSSTFTFTPNSDPNGYDLSGAADIEPLPGNVSVTGQLSCDQIVFGDAGDNIQFTGSLRADGNTMSGNWQSGLFSGTWQAWFSTGPLGSAQLQDYCGNDLAFGPPYAALTQSATGTNHAFNNWACQDDGSTQLISSAGAAPSMADACAFEYGDGINMYAAPLNPDDANSWACFPISLTTTISGPSTATVGDNVEYTVTVHNNGLIAADNVGLDDLLPGSVVSSPGNCGFGEGSDASCNLGTINPGDDASVDFVISTTGLDPGTITNSAVVTPSIHGQENGVSFDTDLEAPEGLTTTVTSSPTTVTAGQNVQYTITVHNPSASDVPAVQTVDTLPSGTTLVSKSTGCTGNGPVTCALGTIPEGGSASATIVVKTATGSAGTTITDSVTTSPGGGSGSAQTHVSAPSPGSSSGFVPPGGSLSTGGTNPSQITLPNTGAGAPVSLTQGTGGFCGGQCSGPVTTVSAIPGYTDAQHPIRLTLTFKDPTFWTAWTDFATSTIFKRAANSVTGVEVPDCNDNPAWTAQQKADAAARRANRLGTQSGIASPSPCVDQRSLTAASPTGPYFVRFFVNMLSGDPGIGRRACSDPLPCNALNPPTSVNVTPTSTNTLSVAFTPGTNTTPPLGFIAMCGSPQDDETVGIFMGNNIGSPITVTGPVIGHVYQCVVEATDANGTGSSDSPVSAPVAAGGPAAPAGVKATTASVAATATTGTLNVAFTAPTVNNGSAITGYTATCSTTATGTGVVPSRSVTRTVTVGVPSSPIPVTGLSVGKVYVCNVAAVNANGAGAVGVAPGVGVGTPAAPAKPGVVRTTTRGQIKVTWVVPANNGKPITLFTATCTTTATGTGVVTTKSVSVASATATTVTVTGLTAGKSYTCKVKATNARGAGLLSPASAALAP